MMSGIHGKKEKAVFQISGRYLSLCHRFEIRKEFYVVLMVLRFAQNHKNNRFSSLFENPIHISNYFLCATGLSNFCTRLKKDLCHTEAFSQFDKEV